MGGKLPLPPRRAGLPGQPEVLYVPGVNTAAPPHVHMDGQSVFRFAVEAVPRCAREVLDRAGLTPEDIDLFVFHQANSASSTLP